MEEFDLYEDLELLHAQEKQEATEDLKWKDKYEVALNTIQKLQAEKKELNKKVKQLETNFACLFDTARTEIKRKDLLICELRKQKDDICFRRNKPQFIQRQLNENADVRRVASSESIHLNPFSREHKIEKPSKNELPKTQFSDDKPSTSSKEQFKNEKRLFDKANYRENVPRNNSQEKDHSRDRHRDRSKDRSRHRNRSSDRLDKRSRHRVDDHNDIKNRFRLEDRKADRSQERSSRRDERYDGTKQNRHNRDVTRSSDSSRNKTDQIHGNSQRMYYTNGDKNKTSSDRYEPTKHEKTPKDPIKKIEEKPKDACKSSNDHTKYKTAKNERNQLQNVLSPSNEKRVNSKIEILQIEILKDAKELKKKAGMIPKLDPIDPAKVAAEKSNQFLEALFDDSIMNKMGEPSMCDDLLFSTQTTDLITDDYKKENNVEKDENFNLNFQTSKRQSPTKLFDDIFGPSPAGSLCALERRHSVKCLGETTSESDFVSVIKTRRNETDEITQLATIPKMPIVEQIVNDGRCSENDTKINKECFEMKPPKNPVTLAASVTGQLDDASIEALKQTDSNADKKQFGQTNEYCNVNQKTPQKQIATKLLDDLFGPSPGDSIYGHKNSITSMDESSSDFYFDPVMKSVNSRKDEQTLAVIPLDVAIAMPENSTDNVISNNVKCLDLKEAIQNETPGSADNTVNDGKTFNFVELDSSFYSSEDDDNSKKSLPTSRDEVESPLYENFTPLKHIQVFETESICKTDPSNNRTETDNSEETKYHKPSLPENQKKSTSERNKHREELCKKDHSKRSSNSSKHNTSSNNSNSRSLSEEQPPSSFRSEKVKKHRHHHHHHHHHHHKHRSSESTHTKSENRVSRTHYKKSNRHLPTHDRNEEKGRYLKEKSNKIDLKNDISEARSSPMLVYYDDDHVNDPSQNHKNADPDQVFFLLCDDISDDDDVFGENSYSDEYKNENKEDKRSMDVQNVKENVIEIDSKDLSSNDKNETEIKQETEESEMTNIGKSNKRDMDSLEPNDKPMQLNASKNENTGEIALEAECIVVSLEEVPQGKELTLTYSSSVGKETSSSIIDENPYNDICRSVELGKIETPICDKTLKTNIYVSGNCEELSYLNATASKNEDQTFSEHHELQNLQQTCEKEEATDNSIKIQRIQNVDTETKNLDDSIEQEKSEVKKTEPCNDDQIAQENLNETDENMDLHTNFQKIQSMSSLEVDLKEQQKHTKDEKLELINSTHSFQSSSLHLEVNAIPKNIDVSNKEQSDPKENNALHDVLYAGKIDKSLMSNGDDVVSVNNMDRGDFNSQRIISNDERPISDEKLETYSGNTSDYELQSSDIIKLATVSNEKHCETNSQETICQNLNKSSDTSQNETVVNLQNNGTPGMSYQITEQVSKFSTQEQISCSTTYGNVSHSTELFPSPVSSQKSLNSADELESLHSNSDCVSSGRRKKIKTPRKRTDVCKNSSNRTMGMVSDRYIKSDGVHTFIPVQSEPEVSSELISPDSDLSDANRIWLEAHQTSNEYKPVSNDYKITENKKEIKTANSTQEDNKLVDEYKPEFPSFSADQLETQRQHAEKPAHSFSKTENVPSFSAAKTIFNKDQQYINSQMNEDSLQTSFPPSISEDQVDNAINVAFIETDKSQMLHSQTTKLKEVEKDLLPGEVASNNSLPSFELNEIKDKEDAANEKSLEPYSITIKRNRTKKKKGKQLTGLIETMPNEVVNDANKTTFLGESIQDRTHEDTSNNGASETTCSSYIDHRTNLNCPESPTNKTQQQQTTNQHQMINSENMLVEACTHSSDEVVGTKPNQKNVNVENRNMLPDSSDRDLKNIKTSSPTSELTKDHAKRKYKTKTKQILGSCNSNAEFDVSKNSISEESKIMSYDDDDDNNQQTSKATQQFKNPDLPETAKKRKNKKKNSHCSLDSTNKSNESCESLEGPKKFSSRLDSSTSKEDVDVINSSTNDESKSVSNDDADNEKTSITMERFKSPDLAETTKKWKHKKQNSNSSLDSSNKINELRESVEGAEKPPSWLYSSTSNEDAEVTNSSTIDESVSNDDDNNQRKSTATIHFKTLDSKESIKKRKHEKKNTNSSSDSKHKSNELSESSSSRLDSSNSYEDFEVTNTNTIYESVSNDDVKNQDKSKDRENFNSDLKETKKRKYKKKNSNSSLDSTKISNDLCESLESVEKPPSWLYSSTSNEDFEVTNRSTVAESLSNEDGNKQAKTKTMKHVNSPDLNETTKKRKYKKTNSNIPLDFTNKMNGNHEKSTSPSQHESASSVENILDKLHSSRQTGKSVDEILYTSNEITDLRSGKSSSDFPDEALEEFCDKNTQVNNTIDCSLNLPLFGEEKEHDSCDIKQKKTRKKTKRKLSRSSEDALVQSKKSKNALENTPESSLKISDTTCPALERDHLESKQPFEQSLSPEKSISIALTPTHHKIFLNDVCPSDPPPVYNANEDDFQYQEIDDRMRSMFQSPSYTQPSNNDSSFDKKNDDIEPTTNENVEVDATLKQNELTQCNTSTSSRKVSLGSNEYVIESIGSHTANVFITRKKIKKRTKVVATAV